MAAVVGNLPSLEEIQANLPAASHGSSRSTGHSHDHAGGGCSSTPTASLRAKAEPLIQILAAPGAKKSVEVLKPTGEFQPKKTKVPLRLGEQRLIIATCEKGTVENLSDMKDIHADIDKIKAANPNFALEFRAC